MVYPSWATPYDMETARRAGLGYQDWQVCPYYDGNTEKCFMSEYWNELACQCFNMRKCKMNCSAREEGTYLIETDPCLCVNRQIAYAQLYPAWATEEQIQAAGDQAAKYFFNEDQTVITYEQPDEWVCEDAPVCKQDQYFNWLACMCMADIEKCDGYCDNNSARDHAGGCLCITDEQNKQYYPESATDYEILYSWRLAGKFEHFTPFSKLYQEAIDLRK